MMATVPPDRADDLTTERSRLLSASSGSDLETFPPDSQPGRTTWRPGYQARRQQSQHGTRVNNHGTFLNIQLPDVEPQEIPPMDNPVTRALDRCQKSVLAPLLRLMLLVGWHPLSRGPQPVRTCFNILYPVFVFFLILLGYIIQYASCFQRNGDTIPDARITNKTSNNSLKHPCEKFLVSTYIVPDILHSTAYFFSLYVFRISRSEQLCTLTQRVFLQSSPTHSGFLSQGKLVRNLKRVLWGGVGWVLLSLAVQILHFYNLSSCNEAPNKFQFAFMNPHGSHFVSYILLIFMFIGLVMLDIVYAAVIINYAVQVSLMTYYIEGLMEKLREKSLGLEESMKKINEIDGHLKDLNDQPASALSIVMFNFLLNLLTSLIGLGNLKTLKVLVILSLILFAILWLFVIIPPLALAARLSAAGNRLRKMGHVIRGRPFGYEDTDVELLNSFLVFVTSTDFRAKVFRIPVRTSYLCGTGVLILFVVLALFQTGTLDLGWTSTSNY